MNMQFHITHTKLQDQSRVAQNVRKVQISKTKTFWPHMQPFQTNVSMGQNMQKNGCVFAIFLSGPMGPILLVWICPGSELREMDRLDNSRSTIQD